MLVYFTGGIELKLKVYGIPNCDKVRDAKKALLAHDIEFEFIDYKKTPPGPALLEKWKKQIGDLPINKKGTTYRKIKEAFEAASASEKIKLMCENYSAIKRPLFEKNGSVIGVGLSEDILKQIKS